MYLVTGGNGFVGAALLRRLAADLPDVVRGAIRRADAALPDGVERVVVAGSWPEADWTVALNGVTAVIHAAARVHVMRDSHVDQLSRYRQVNVDGTLNLARQAVAAGVQRFVFVSSIKVNGDSASPARPFRADDVPNPSDAYSVSKLEAEVALRNLAVSSGIELVIVRPPLVYGPGVRANFRSMMQWLCRGVPLPLANLQNSRSLVAIDNLVDLLACSAVHPAAPGRVLMVSDGDDMSTSELLRRMGVALGRSPRLFHMPEFLMRSSARVLGREDIVERLFGSLCVDISETRRALCWSPPVSVDTCLRHTAEAFLNEAHA